MGQHGDLACPWQEEHLACQVSRHGQTPSRTLRRQLVVDHRRRALSISLNSHPCLVAARKCRIRTRYHKRGTVMQFGNLRHHNRLQYNDHPGLPDHHSVNLLGSNNLQYNNNHNNLSNNPCRNPRHSHTNRIALGSEQGMKDNMMEEKLHRNSRKRYPIRPDRRTTFHR